MNDNLHLNICHHTPSTEITEDDIEEKAPDIVVFEILERMLNNYTDDLRYWQKYY